MPINEHGFLVDEKGRRLYERPDGSTILRTWDAVLNGNVPLSDLDDEELKRAKLRDRNGDFMGKAGAMVPRELMDKRTREIMSRVQEQFREVAMEATKVFTDVLEDVNASHADKMKAAEYLHQRFLGKVPDKVELTAEMKPWEGLVSGGILRDLPEETPDGK